MDYVIYQYKDNKHTVFDSRIGKEVIRERYTNVQLMKKLQTPTIIFARDGKNIFNYNVRTQDYEWTTQEGMFICLKLSHVDLPEFVEDHIQTLYQNRTV